MANYQSYTLADAPPSTRGLFSAVSLFAGGGGSSTGLKLAGGHVRVAVEFSPWAASVYRANHPTTQVVQRSVRDIVRSTGGIESLLETGSISVGNLCYLDASPPCQPHSQAGRGMGDPSRATVHSGVEQTYAATLPFDVADFAHRARPKVCVMENVPGLVQRTPQFFERILDAFRFEGACRRYYSNWKMLSSDDFGVPQKRHRVFVVSIRRDVAEAVGIHSDDAVREVFPTTSVSGFVDIRSGFKGLEQSPEDARPFLISIRRSRLPKLLKQLPKCPPRHQRLKNVTSYFTLVRCSWDHPAPTLVIAGQKPDGLSGAIHPEIDRKFTIPELKRLFSLPDDYRLLGTVEQAVDTICNMVPPLLAKALAESIYERVLRHVEHI